MRLGTCSREGEVMDLLRSGHWPESCDLELRAHVDCCGICRDTVTVQTALQRAAAESRGAARLESPSLLWWRAQLRRRNEALERMNRPVAGAQRFALAVNLLVAAALVVWLARRTDLWGSWLAAIQSGTLGQGWLESIAQGGNLMLLIPCAGIIALLSGVAVYLATDRS
jgi:hypothetical protein